MRHGEESSLIVKYLHKYESICEIAEEDIGVLFDEKTRDRKSLMTVSLNNF
jgi:hypothetical protein